MKEYTSSSPVFLESIEIPEVTDTNHVDHLNPAPMQLLQNTLANRQAIESIGEDIASSTDAVYQQSTGYTDTKIAELINGAPSTLDTLGEIAQAMQDNESVVEALESAIGSKAPQAELDGHTGNSTIHITASERASWNSKMGKNEDAGNTTVTFTEASVLSNINSGEKTGSIMGKISKAISTLISHISAKATADTFGHVKLSDTYQNAVADGDAANGMGASQKALADAYSELNSNLADSLGGITFGMDDEGNYGYIRAGADTVTPFKSGLEISETINNDTSGYRNNTLYAATVTKGSGFCDISAACNSNTVTVIIGSHTWTSRNVETGKIEINEGDKISATSNASSSIFNIMTLCRVSYTQ